MTLKSDISIWHYLDLAKYVGLLSRGLFFALPSALRLNDPWEGSLGEIDFRESLDRTVHSSPEGVSEWQAARKVRHANQDNYGVSCWHESQSESAALWSLYAPLGLGVAVRSTPARIQSALGERAVDARRIDYAGHRDRKLGEDPKVLLSIKRPEFKHEAEVRFFALLTPDEKTVLNFYSTIEDHGKVRRIKPGNKRPLITPLGGFAVSDSRNTRQEEPPYHHKTGSTNNDCDP